MGYNSINQAIIERDYNNRRKIRVKVYCDELKQWEVKTFPIEALDLALDWIASKMKEVTM